MGALGADSTAVLHEGKSKHPSSLTPQPAGHPHPGAEMPHSCQMVSLWDWESSAVIYHCCCSDVPLNHSLRGDLPHLFSPNLSLMSSLRGLGIALTSRGKCKDLFNALLLSHSLRPLFLSTSWATLGALDFCIPYAPLHGRRQML